MKKATVVFIAVVFSIVTQRSSKVEASQNTLFDKRIVSKQNTSAQSRLGEHGPLRPRIVDVSDQRCRDRSHARAYSTKDEGLFRSVDSQEPITQPGILCLHIPVTGFRRTQQATKSSKVVRQLREYPLTMKL